ncbi:MAG TPA: hypothetical protein VHZ24_05975 [Pirellulales bacterium]|jgi:hypothetical protein|nr:hypothetical protein [Pirellulales bacterium]
MAKVATRRRTLRPDDNGDYRPYIGWREPAKQQRFNLGKDLTEAEWRYAAIHRLYADDCRESEQNLWSLRGLTFAKEIAAGKKVIELSAPPPQDRGAVIEFQQGIEHARQSFPSLTITPADETVFGESVEQNQDLVAGRLKELETELKRMGALLSTDALPNRLIPGTFHEALDAYSKMIERDGERLPNGLLKHSQRKRLKMVERFKDKHRNLPLCRLNFDEGSHLIAFWRKRPKTLKKSNCSRSHSKHHVGELIRFYKWLDQTDQFQWAMPKGLLSVSRKIPKLDSEKKTSAISKLVYTPDQLAVLNKHATPLERLCIYVGLNCGMGAAELGRVLISDILLSHEHEHGKRLRIETNTNDNWIRMNRPKTDVFGEWRLWPETVVMLQWAIKRAHRLGTDLVFVKRNGEPIFDEISDKPEYGFTNLWTGLLRRVRRHDEGFGKLPFGTLRDTLPDYLRAEFGEEMASMCLAHGRPVNADTLLDCYANRPFGRFHQVLPQARTFFEPMFQAVTDPLAGSDEEPLRINKKALKATIKKKIDKKIRGREQSA